MNFKWVQVSTRAGEFQRWMLVHKETRRAILEIRLSPLAEVSVNGKILRKIRRAYEWYFQKVWFNSLGFF
jgi:hypothetical protein